MLGLSSASPALVFLLFRQIGFFKGTLYNCGGMKFVPSYSEVRSFMKDNLGVPLEIMGSLVSVTRMAADGGGGDDLVFLFKESGEKDAE